MRHKLIPHPRKRLRLKKYDYSLPGYYFVTICTANRLCLFGEVIQNVMLLNDAGKMVHHVWSNLTTQYTNIFIDTFIVMPNHIHAVVIINDNTKGPIGKLAPTQQLLPKIIKGMKTYTTNCYIKGVYKQGYQPFYGCLWQRSFHDHIIRNEENLSRIRQYILDNPAKWEEDEDNPLYAKN